MAEQRSPRGTRDPEPWYADGLRFTCQPECGACCTNHDDYAYVYLEGDDLENLACLLGLEPERVRALYTEDSEGHTVLKLDRPECPFLDGSRCSVYPARPTQCRTFPFWRENLSDPESWARLRTFCPGIDRGERRSLLSIRTKLAQRETE